MQDRCLLGVSTSALADKSALEELLWYEPDLVEFYNYPSPSLAVIAAFSAKYDVRVALHAPTPYDASQPLRRFSLTGTDPMEVQQAFDLVESTARAAQQLDAIHVVIHFPAPYPPFESVDFEKRCSVALRHIAECGERFGVKMLIENLSANPLLCTPTHYAVALDAEPTIEMCLDIGHAHLFEPFNGPRHFADVMRERIASVHVYNTSADNCSALGHEMPSRTHTIEDGYVALENILGDVLQQCRPHALVLEHAARFHDAEQAERVGHWMRNIISREMPSTLEGV